jgi:hypothetical protein
MSNSACAEVVESQTTCGPHAPPSIEAMIFAARERRAAISLAVIATVAKRSRVPGDSPSMRSQNRSCSPGFSNSRLLGARRGQTGRVGGGGTLDCYTRNDGSRVMGLVDPDCSATRQGAGPAASKRPIASSSVPRFLGHRLISTLAPGCRSCLLLGSGRHRQSKKHEHSLIESQDIFVIQPADARANLGLGNGGDLVHYQAACRP